MLNLKGVFAWTRNCSELSGSHIWRRSAVAAFRQSTTARNMPKSARALLLTGLLALAGCHATPTGSNETETQAALSLRLDSLEARVSSLEAQMRNRDSVQHSQSAVESGTEDNDTTSADPAQNEAFDDQDYQREIQALCAAKGVDCSQ